MQKSVKFEPESQPISPAAYHCVHVSPRKTTTYTLTAEDAEGNTKTATAEVESPSLTDSYVKRI